MTEIQKNTQPVEHEATVAAPIPENVAKAQPTPTTEPTRGQKIVWKSGWAAGASIPD